MATPQLSPGVLTREVDLTVGRAENVLDNIGAIAGPFEIGPIDEATDITTENQLINTFGKPISTDAQYEYWMAASSFLSYGGVLKVVRPIPTETPVVVPIAIVWSAWLSIVQTLRLFAQLPGVLAA